MGWICMKLTGFGPADKWGRGNAMLFNKKLPELPDGAVGIVDDTTHYPVVNGAVVPSMKLRVSRNGQTMEFMEPVGVFPSDQLLLKVMLVAG